MIDKLLYRMSRVLLLIASIGLTLMMVQTVVDVIADNFFGRPIPGNLEVISVYHMVLVVFLPLAMVEWKHENIQVDLFYLMMPPWAQRCCAPVAPPCRHRRRWTSCPPPRPRWPLHRAHRPR